MSKTSPHLPLTVIKTSRLPPELESNFAREVIEINERYNGLLRAEVPTNNRKLLKQLANRADNVIEAGFMGSATLNLAGRIQADLFNYTHASNYYEKALELEPDNPQTLCNKGYLALAQADHEAAKQSFNHALLIEKHNLAAFKGLAHSYLIEGKYDIAVLHYQSLLAYGLTDKLVQEHATQCIENLKCDEYTEQFENLVLYLATLETTDPARLNRFAGELFSCKYKLNTELEQVDLDQAIQDPLFLLVLESGLSANDQLELLITEVRRCITFEATQSLNLRDELLPCATAVGIYAAQTDYALYQTEDEEAQLSALKHILEVSLTEANTELDDCIGALILLSMYEPLYVQRFVVHLLARDLHQWPVGAQGVLKAALYDLSLEHQTRYELFGNSVSEMLDNSVNRAADKWEPYPSPFQQSIYQALSRQWSATETPIRFAEQEVRILLVECGSGKRAYEMASRFNNTDVLATDSCKRNLSYALTKTRPLQLENLNFAYCESYDAAPDDIGEFDIIEFGPQFDYSHAEEWLRLLASDGLVRFQLPSAKQQEQVGVLSELVRARHLQSSLDNIRMLRHSIMLEKQTALWQDLFSNPAFFSSAGCRDLLFANRTFYDEEQARHLLEKLSVKVIAKDAQGAHVVNLMRALCERDMVLDFYAQPAA